MEDTYRKSLSEVWVVLQHTDFRTVEKISKEFIKFISQNMDINYNPNINFYDKNWEQYISEDAQAMLALIYRDYICSKDERKKILLEEAAEEKRKEMELREKYNPDNLFAKEIPKKSEISDNLQLIEIKEEPWYKKILKTIIGFFGKRN